MKCLIHQRWWDLISLCRRVNRVFFDGNLSYLTVMASWLHAGNFRVSEEHLWHTSGELAILWFTILYTLFKICFGFRWKYLRNTLWSKLALGHRYISFRAWSQPSGRVSNGASTPRARNKGGGTLAKCPPTDTISRCERKECLINSPIDGRCYRFFL